MGDFWAITVFFNPAHYKSLLRNYHVFSETLKKQKVNLLTVELAFNDDDFEIPIGDNVHHLRSNSVMWQKERLLNYGLSQLPSSCDSFGWIDCDVLFPNTNWVDMARAALDQNDLIQLFKKVIHLPPNDEEYKGKKIIEQQSVMWQKVIHKNWLQRRKNKELPFSAPGFAWAARRETFADIGLYDKNIVGSGDTFMVDCVLDSWDIHGYAMKFTDPMKVDSMEWCDRIKKKNIRYNYLPIDVYHLFHGSLKNRKYMDRHTSLWTHVFDPKTDIKIVNNVFEWASDKPQMQSEIRQYFFDRNEDEFLGK